MESYVHNLQTEVCGTRIMLSNITSVFCETSYLPGVLRYRKVSMYSCKKSCSSNVTNVCSFCFKVLDLLLAIKLILLPLPIKIIAYNSFSFFLFQPSAQGHLLKGIIGINIFFTSFRQTTHNFMTITLWQKCSATILVVLPQQCRLGTALESVE